jgi:threonyl-tRNA synthetase
MLVVGANEAETGAVSVRKRGEDGDMGSMPLDDFIAIILKDINTKQLQP